jgi:septum site-determining protein MinC
MRTQHVVLKGTREGLVLYFDPQLEFNLLTDELEKYLTSAAPFLQGAVVRCYGEKEDFTKEQRKMLTAILEQFGLQLAGWLNPADQSFAEKESKPVAGLKKEGYWEEGMTEGNCLIVERTLRSGKSVCFDGHVVILGDVNPGAEVIASGNIIVLGALRGVAHAGAAGNRKALVNAYYLNPTQLRIADFVTRAPDEEVVWRGPEIAKISDNKLVVEKMVMNVNRGKNLHN